MKWMNSLPSSFTCISKPFRFTPLFDGTTLFDLTFSISQPAARAYWISSRSLFKSIFFAKLIHHSSSSWLDFFAKLIQNPFRFHLKLELIVFLHEAYSKAFFISQPQAWAHFTFALWSISYAKHISLYFWFYIPFYFTDIFDFKCLFELTMDFTYVSNFIHNPLWFQRRFWFHNPFLFHVPFDFVHLFDFTWLFDYKEFSISYVFSN